MNRAVACSIGASLLLSAAPLSAEGERTARLEYTRGAGATHCPDEATLRGAVAAMLGYDPFRSEAPRTITATIAQRGRVLRADVTLTDAKGKVAGARQLSSRQNDCSELVATMTLAISLAIDPQSQLRAPKAESPPPPSPAPAPSHAPSPPLNEPAREPPPPPAAGRAARPPALPAATPPAGATPKQKHKQNLQPRLEVHGGFGGFVSIGAVPTIGLGISAEIGVRRGSLSAAVEGRADLPASAEATGGGVVRAWLLLATLAPCYHVDPLLLCPLVSVGAFYGSGSEVPEPREDTTVFAAAGARLGVDLLRAGPFSARLHGDLAATLTPTSLRLYDRDVWRTPPLHVAAGLAGLVRFL